MWPLLMAGGALFKAIGDSQSADNDRHYQAETARYSPWTKLASQAPKKFNAAGSLLGGSLAGLSLGKGMKSLMDGGGALEDAGGAMAGGGVAPKFNLMSSLYNKPLVDTGAGALSGMGGQMNNWSKLAMMNPSKFNLGVDYNFGDL